MIVHPISTARLASLWLLCVRQLAKVLKLDKGFLTEAVVSEGAETVNKIKGQADKVSELLFSADTGAAYKKTAILTWEILRETGVLLWLIVCFVFIGGEWFWKNSISLGRQARDRYNTFQQPSSEEPRSMSDIGQSAASAITSSFETLLYQAKQQLDIEAEPPAPKLSTDPSTETSVKSTVDITLDSSTSDSTESAASTPPTIVAKYNSPDSPETPGTKTALASAANQAQKMDSDEEGDIEKMD